jgi:hypothetical protein
MHMSTHNYWITVASRKPCFRALASCDPRLLVRLNAMDPKQAWASGWTPIELTEDHLCGGDLPADFCSVLAMPVFSSRAQAILQPVKPDRAEWLAFFCRSEQLFGLHILDALDWDVVNQTDSINLQRIGSSLRSFDRLVLEPKKIVGCKDVLHFRPAGRASLLVSDNLRRIIEASELSGFWFERKVELRWHE